MKVSRAKVFQGLCVAMENFEIRLYNNKNLLTTIKCDESILGMYCGKIGREEGCLTVCHGSGAINIKILNRLTNLDTINQKQGPPSEQDIPLNIPKKTKL